MARERDMSALPDGWLAYRTKRASPTAETHLVLAPSPRGHRGVDAVVLRSSTAQAIQRLPSSRSPSSRPPHPRIEVMRHWCEGLKFLEKDGLEATPTAQDWGYCRTGPTPQLGFW